jgi:glutaredoxin
VKNKSAKIDRMVTPDHLCPWGLKALSILKRKGYEIEDNHISSMEDNKK